MANKAVVAAHNSSRPTRQHLMVVITFIVAASMLVVLTTFAINMLTATGDMNQLLARWSQSNGDSMEAVFDYFENGEEVKLEAYRHYAEQREFSGAVISELLSEEPDANLIFSEFSLDEIHPNELTGLIRIYTLFEDASEIQQIKNTWSKVQLLDNDKHALIDSLIALKQTSDAFNEGSAELIQDKNQDINSLIRVMILGNSATLILLKRYALWFTVLLGILIVLIGIIYTVRGFKNIRGMQQLLAERDYLAMFPELNQFPVMNLNTNGEVGFLNQATRNLFPELSEEELKHPFLKHLRNQFEEITSEPGNARLFEIEVDGKYYQQAAHYLSAEKGIHIHSIDITELKKKQLELTHTLNEKESLLAEVHHRVKNNMAVITGLLELQEMMGDDPNSALAESRSRIKSMAIIHELLYQSSTFSEIDTSQYLQKLGEHLRLSLSNIKSVSVKDSDTKKFLNINQAVPLGLLLNELAFYICKEAAPGDESLELELQMVSKHEHLCMRVTSPQKSIDNPLKKEDEPTLRMSLIKNLLTQIEGELLMPKSQSLVIEIIFLPTIKRGSSSTLI